MEKTIAERRKMERERIRKQANKQGTVKVASKVSSKSTPKTKMGMDMYGKMKAVPNLSAMKKRKMISSMD